MKKALGFILALVACIALVLVPNAGAVKPAPLERLEVSELVVRDPSTGNSVTITAGAQGSGIFVTNNRNKRTVCLSAFGTKEDDYSQTFIGIFTDKQSRIGKGHNWAVSLDREGRPVQQVANEHDVKTREIR